MTARTGRLTGKRSPGLGRATRQSASPRRRCQHKAARAGRTRASPAPSRTTQIAAGARRVRRPPRKKGSHSNARRCSALPRRGPARPSQGSRWWSRSSPSRPAQRFHLCTRIAQAPTQLRLTVCPTTVCPRRKLGPRAGFHHRPAAPRCSSRPSAPPRPWEIHLATEVDKVPAESWERVIRVAAAVGERLPAVAPRSRTTPLGIRTVRAACRPRLQPQPGADRTRGLNRRTVLHGVEIAVIPDRPQCRPTVGSTAPSVSRAARSAEPTAVANRSLTAIALPLARFSRLNSESSRKRLQARSIRSNSSSRILRATPSCMGPDRTSCAPVPRALKDTLAITATSRWKRQPAGRASEPEAPAGAQASRSQSRQDLPREPGGRLSEGGSCRSGARWSLSAPLPARLRGSAWPLGRSVRRSPQRLQSP